MEAFSFHVASISTPSLSINPSSGFITANEKPPCSARAKSSPDGAKPKQSKSRNGCTTCKLRRLKCDEAKPICNQCVTRKVLCGGYTKNFKWRAFEETPRKTCSPVSVKSAVKGSTGRSPSSSHKAVSSPQTNRSTCIPQASHDDHPDKKVFTNHVEQSYEQVPDFYTFTDPDKNIKDEDCVEEIHRPDIMRIPGFYRESSSSSSSTSSDPDHSFVFNQPRFAGNSPELLALNYDRNTCRILSVKDGLYENPWRTLIWPMAKDSPALYHALTSLSAFHCSGSDYHMKLTGMHHMSESVSQLYKNINNMSVEESLATSVVLALADTWDKSISTGKEHVRGGSALISHALVKMKKQETVKSEPILKFLCRAWLYIDVLSRLTSPRSDDDQGARLWEQVEPLANSNKIDPLLGCASTLFPIIGRVANLVNIVRETETNSVSTISRANQLKQELMGWSTPSFIQVPEDSSCQIQHSIQTAEAYRWATILLLHQACPELPAFSSESLAQRVLFHLASVPIQSGTIIIHIYPLLVASCELTEADDRAWAMDRWQRMRERMQISNIDRCIEVVREVWERRDHSARQNEVLNPNCISGSTSGVEAVQQLPYARTVRGSEHWSSIMKELNWEVMLG